MDGVTPVNVLSVGSRESSSGQAGQTVPSVLRALTKTVDVLTLWLTCACTHTHTYAYIDDILEIYLRIVYHEKRELRAQIFQYMF